MHLVDNLSPLQWVLYMISARIHLPGVGWPLGCGTRMGSLRPRIDRLALYVYTCGANLRHTSDARLGIGDQNWLLMTRRKERGAVIRVVRHLTGHKEQGARFHE